MTLMVSNSTLEYLTNSRFYFSFNNELGLLIAKISGVGVTMKTTDGTAPIGSRKGSSVGAFAETQATPTGASTENITLEFVTAPDNNILYTWYQNCHPKALGTSARDTFQRRYPCYINALNQAGEIAARWEISNSIPASYKTTRLAAEASELFKETVEIAHTGLIRVVPLK